MRSIFLFRLANFHNLLNLLISSLFILTDIVKCVNSMESSKLTENPLQQISPPLYLRKEMEESYNSSNLEEEDLEEEDLESRIFNGNFATRSYPFMAYIVHAKPSGFQLLGSKSEQKFNVLCGASIIGKQSVWTAGHCADPIHRLKSKGHQVELWTGTNDISTIPPSSHRFEIDEIQVAEGFNPKDKFRNDAAIIRLKKPFHFDEKVQQSCLGMGNYDDRKVILLGCGQFDCSHPSTRLREAHGIVRSIDECGDIENLKDDQLCCQLTARNDDEEPVTADQAPGDSGGPLVIMMGDKSVMVGSVSFNFVETATKCPFPDQPSVFCRVASKRQFIEKHVPDAKYC